jgi:hypothetical protein
MNYNPIYDLLRADGSIVVNKNLIFALGLHESIIYAELVSRFIYFADRDNLTEDGYFFNTIDDLYSGTGIGEKPQRTAIKNLQKLGLIHMNTRGIPPKRYFEIIDNPQLLSNLLQYGRERKAKTLGTSKFLPNGGLKTSQVAETITPYGRTNNTKVNNTNGIIQTLYIDLPIDGHIFFNIYEDYFFEKFGRKHMRLTEEQLNNVESAMSELVSCDVDAVAFEEAVAEHFATLPKSNNGNIISFLTASMRYFCVHTGNF